MIKHYTCYGTRLLLLTSGVCDSCFCVSLCEAKQFHKPLVMCLFFLKFLCGGGVFFSFIIKQL